MVVEEKEITYNIKVTEQEVKAILASLIVANKQFCDVDAPQIKISDREGGTLKAMRALMKDSENILHSLYSEEISE